MRSVVRGYPRRLKPRSPPPTSPRASRATHAPELCNANLAQFMCSVRVRSSSRLGLKCWKIFSGGHYVGNESTGGSQWHISAIGVHLHKLGFFYLHRRLRCAAAVPCFLCPPILPVPLNCTKKQSQKMQRTRRVALCVGYWYANNANCYGYHTHTSTSSYVPGSNLGGFGAAHFPGSTNGASATRFLHCACKKASQMHSPPPPSPPPPLPSPPPPSSSAPAGCPDGGSSLKIPQGFLVEGFCWYYGGASQTCDQSCADIPGGSNQGPPLPLLPEQVERPTHRNCAMQTWLNSCAPCVCAVQVAWDLNVGKSSPGAIMSEMKALAVLNGISLPSGFTCTSWDSSTSIGGYGVLPQSLASCARPFFLSH